MKIISPSRRASLAVFAILSMLVTLMSSLPVAHASAITYYVAANGSKSNNGTSLSTPQTIQKCAVSQSA